MGVNTTGGYFILCGFYEEEIMKGGAMAELGVKGRRESKGAELGFSRCRKTIKAQRWDAFSRLKERRGSLAA